MARRGRFGRLPQAQPSLTATLVAISREMENQRDQNIMDAWKNGGTFEGKKVTDGMVLDHWRMRLDGVAKDDPLYDTYKNTLTQYEYSIAESKMSTKYALGDVSDRDMANFYFNWSKKVPKGSEFYRVLQRDGAQFLRAAKAKSEAEAKQRAEERYQTQQQNTYNDKEAPGVYLNDVLTKMAIANGLIPPGSDLRSFSPEDPSVMTDLLDQINGTPVPFAPGLPFADPNKPRDYSNVLYTDPVTQKPVTAQEVRDALAAFGGFDAATGTVNSTFVTDTFRTQIAGQTERIERAKDTGHESDANNISKWQADVAEIGRTTGAWDAQTSYMDARGQWLAVWADPTALPSDKVAATNKYFTTLGALAKTPGLDDFTRTRLEAEAAGNANVQSLAESFTGYGDQNNTTTMGPGTQGDIAETWADLSRYQAWVEVVNTPGSGYVWTTGSTNDAGVFVPNSRGLEIGAAPAVDVIATSPEPPVEIVVPSATGTPVTVVGIGRPVNAKMTDADGNAVTHYSADGSSGTSQVATAYTVSIGGVKSTVYSYRDADGKTYYTSEPPWDSRLQMRDTDAGLVVSLDAMAITKRNVVGKDGKSTIAYFGPDGKPLTTEQVAELKQGKGPYTIDKQGNIAVNAKAMTYGTDPARAKAGPDPLTDSFSPTLAALMGTPEGQKTLASLANDKTFMAQLERDAYEAAGFTPNIDPRTNQQVGWTGGNQADLNKYMAQTKLWTSIPALQNGFKTFVGEGLKLFDRTKTTFGLNAGEQTSTPVPAFDPKNPFGYDGKTDTNLPADRARGTGFDALANIFEPFTNLFKPNTPAQTGISIQTRGTITTPNAPATTTTPTPNVNANTGFTTPVTPNVSPSTGFTTPVTPNVNAQTGFTVPRPPGRGPVPL